MKNKSLKKLAFTLLFTAALLNLEPLKAGGEESWDDFFSTISTLRAQYKEQDLDRRISLLRSEPFNDDDRAIISKSLLALPIDERVETLEAVEHLIRNSDPVSAKTVEDIITSLRSSRKGERLETAQAVRSLGRKPSEIKHTLVKFASFSVGEKIATAQALTSLENVSEMDEFLLSMYTLAISKVSVGERPKAIQLGIPSYLGKIPNEFRENNLLTLLMGYYFVQATEEDEVIQAALLFSPLSFDLGRIITKLSICVRAGEREELARAVLPFFDSTFTKIKENDLDHLLDSMSKVQKGKRDKVSRVTRKLIEPEYETDDVAKVIAACAKLSPLQLQAMFDLSENRAPTNCYRTVNDFYIGGLRGDESYVSLQDTQNSTSFRLYFTSNEKIILDPEDLLLFARGQRIRLTFDIETLNGTLFYVIVDEDGNVFAKQPLIAGLNTFEYVVRTDRRLGSYFLTDDRNLTSQVKRMSMDVSAPSKKLVLPSWNSGFEVNSGEQHPTGWVLYALNPSKGPTLTKVENPGHLTVSGKRNFGLYTAPLNLSSFVGKRIRFSVEVRTPISGYIEFWGKHEKDRTTFSASNEWKRVSVETVIEAGNTAQKLYIGSLGEGGLEVRDLRLEEISE